MYSRFDDWKILSGIRYEDKICFIDLINNPLFENLKLKKNVIQINKIQLINKLVEQKIELDKIVISDFSTYKKIPNRIQTDLKTLLKINCKIILFKKNKPPFINLNFNSNQIFSKMILVGHYSILPFYDENPLFFLPIHKTNYIKHSLKIMISIMNTISPESRKKFGSIFTISILIISLLSKLNLHIIFRLFSFGNILIFKKND